MIGNAWFVVCRERVLSVLARPDVYAAAALLAGLSIASMLQGRSDLDEHHARYQEGLQERVETQLRTRVPNPRAVDLGLRVLRPPTETTVLLRGTAASLPSGWDLGPSGTEERPPYPRDGTRIESSVSLDFEGVVLVFGGLLSLAFGLQMVLSDRESRWTSALRALPIRWRDIALARVSAGAVVVAVMLALWLAAVAAATGVVEPATAAELRRTISFMAVPTFLYLSAFHMLGMAAALSSDSALRAVVKGMAIWLSITFILPQVLTVVSRTIVPRMARHTMERERRSAHADSVKQFEDAMGRMIGERIPDWEILRRVLHVDEPEVAHLHLNTHWLAGIAAARRVADEFDAHWLGYMKVRRQFQNRSMALSPASALTVGLSELAGVGETSVQSWERAVEAHYRAVAAVLFDDRSQLGGNVVIGNQTSPIAFRRHPPRPYPVLPAFQEPETHSRAAWLAARRPLAWLSLHAALALTWAYVAGVRDLRRGTHAPAQGL